MIFHDFLGLADRKRRPLQADAPMVCFTWQDCAEKLVELFDKQAPCGLLDSFFRFFPPIIHVCFKGAVFSLFVFDFNCCFALCFSSFFLVKAPKRSSEFSGKIHGACSAPRFWPRLLAGLHLQRPLSTHAGPKALHSLFGLQQLGGFRRFAVGGGWGILLGLWLVRFGLLSC